MITEELNRGFGLYANKWDDLKLLLRKLNLKNK